jgi:uncharacterized protein YndB with AHSA1/START domain
MKPQLLIKNIVKIAAPAAIVWDVLTNPAQTKKYMFGCETVSDWKKGSTLDWRLNYEGKDMVAVKGSIVGIEPGKSLVYTVFDPHSTMEDIPENYLTVNYTLEQMGNQTELTVVQGDYNQVGEGERRYQEAYNGGEGWNPILIEIKKLAESLKS